MKRIVMFLLPLLIAVIIFFGLIFFLDTKGGKGALQVTSIPQSKVFLDSKLLGTTPLCACELHQMLNVGDHTVKLIPLSGEFRPFEDKITINKGTLTVVDRTFADNGESEGGIISLSPLNNKKDVEILVVSLPDKSNVFLDNNPVGVTPLLLRNVSESDHDLRVTLFGYKDKSLKIKTAAGFKLSSIIFLGISNELSNPTASPSSTPTPKISKILILNTPTGFLRVRADSSISSSEIAQVKPGEEYELIDEKEGWFEIKLNDSKKGWISSSYAVINK